MTLEAIIIIQHPHHLALIYKTWHCLGYVQITCTNMALSDRDMYKLLA